MSTAAFLFSVAFSLLALGALALMVYDLVDRSREMDDKLAKVDDDLNVEYRWGGGWRV